MEQKKRSTIRKIESHKSEPFYLIVRGLEVGIVAGLVAVLYRYLLSFAENGMNSVLTYIKGKPMLSLTPYSTPEVKALWEPGFLWRCFHATSVQRLLYKAA